MSAYVLILDDDEAMRELLEITLSDEGYDVRSAASSDEALASAAQQASLPIVGETRETSKLVMRVEKELSP